MVAERVLLALAALQLSGIFCCKGGLYDLDFSGLLSFWHSGLRAIPSPSRYSAMPWASEPLSSCPKSSAKGQKLRSRSSLRAAELAWTGPPLGDSEFLFRGGGGGGCPEPWAPAKRPATFRLLKLTTIRTWSIFKPQESSEHDAQVSNCRRRVCLGLLRCPAIPTKSGGIEPMLQSAPCPLAMTPKDAVAWRFFGVCCTTL